MENRICIELLKNKQEEWNNQRLIAGIDAPNFRNTNFSLEFHGESLYDLPEFFDLNFSNSDMNMVSLRNCTFTNCCFDGAHITFADLVDDREGDPQDDECDDYLDAHLCRVLCQCFEVHSVCLLLNS